MYKTERFSSMDFKPKVFESDGTIEILGRNIPYHTVSEDNVFYDGSGMPIASIFSYSYFRSDADDLARRPVIFAYNGGPGSSSMYLHAGFLGTKRIKYEESIDRPTALPPYEVIDNPDCLLDVADIVLIDPVGTGYGVLLDDTCEKQFYGIEEDAEALLIFIEKWLHRYNRWLSPKYLIGESYGCTRSATAAGIAATMGKECSYNLAFDGIIMIGNTVTTGKNFFQQSLPVELSVLGFPTYAAVNWYHNHPSDQSIENFVAEARKFADNDYFSALYQGSSFPIEKLEEIAERVSYYTGVSKKFLFDRNLRIDDASYRSEVLRMSGRAVARYDGRFTRPLYQPQKDEEKYGEWDDASNDRYGAYFRSALNGTILPGLNIELDRVYVASLKMFTKWNGEITMGTTAEHLRNAMHRTPGMRTFFANGWYDLCTEVGYVYYVLNHAGLPEDRVIFKGYPSGHMIYIGEENIKTLSYDIREFLQGRDPAD